MIFPEYFKMVDDGHYGHDVLEYICSPNKFIIKNKNGHEQIALYDNDFNLIKSSLIKPEPDDPRWIIKNCKKANLQKYGLDGNGYIITELKPVFFFPGSIILVKFISDRQFIKYAFFEKDGKYIEFDKQRWIFNIINLTEQEYNDSISNVLISNNKNRKSAKNIFLISLITSIVVFYFKGFLMFILFFIPLIIFYSIIYNIFKRILKSNKKE